MTLYYIDASALVKRYLGEPGSAWLNDLFEAPAANSFVSSELVAVELIAALSRARREKRINEVRRNRLALQVAQEWRSLLESAAVTRRTITTASELALGHPLRAYDAVHLATAITIQSGLTALDIQGLVFMAADKALLLAAQAEGFLTDNPNDHA